MIGDPTVTIEDDDMDIPEQLEDDLCNQTSDLTITEAIDVEGIVDGASTLSRWMTHQSLIKLRPLILLDIQMVLLNSRMFLLYLQILGMSLMSMEPVLFLRRMGILILLTTIG